MTEPPPAESAPRASRWEDFLDVFYAPAQVFERRRDSNPLPPLLVLTLVMAVLYLAIAPLLQPIIDAEWERTAATMLRANPELTPEQLELGRKFTGTLGVVFVLVFVPIGVLMSGLALWVVGKLFESTQSVRSALVVAAYASFPRIVEQVLSAIQALVLDLSQIDSRFGLTFGVARFLDPDTTTPVVLGVLSRVNLFALWITVLLAIGLRVTGRVPGPQAALAAAIVWVLGAVPTVLGAMFSGGG